jgi:tetratricopeptide (TPR) repeat protein/tRNA A-37 threonylcarbamoyl transferase component Bud32
VTGRKVSHYRLNERIGHGAFGTVYKAEDLTLGRTVAIKAIKAPDQDPRITKERFLREAQAISQIDHPNVVTLFEVFQEGATNYLVMQYVKGGSLREVLGQGPVGVERALRVASDIAAGLEAAHAIGVIHRDVKPENVIVEPSGRAKVVDFGVARLVDRSTLTKRGRIVGTLPYMAPEQVKGHAVDARIDVYALGVVLYEMLGGRRPFESGEEAALFYQIVNVDPEPLGARVHGLPRGIEAIVSKALEKNPERRYATAAEMRHDIEIVLERLRGESNESKRLIARRRRRIGAGAWTAAIVLAAAAAVVLWRVFEPPKAPKAPPRIMVAPAINSLNNRELDYLSGGMMDGMITALAGAKGFTVVSRQAVASAQKVLDVSGTGPSARGAMLNAARQIGSDYVVSPSFARSGAVVRLSCQLDDVKKGEIIGSWYVDMSDLDAGFFATIDELAGRVAQALGASPGSGSPGREAERILLTKSMDALKYYEMGIDASEAGNAPRVVENMRAAVERDPEFTAAYLYLAQWSPEPEEAKSALEQAMRHRQNAPPALQRIVEAEDLVVKDRIEEAIRGYESAIAVDPEQVLARTALVSLLVRTRRFEEAVAEFGILKRVTPFDYSFYPEWWMAYFETGREDKALAILHEWRARMKREPAPLIQLIFLNGVMGRMDACLAYCDTLEQIDPNARDHRGHVLIFLGRLDEAEAIFERMVSNPDPFYARGRGYTYLSEVDYQRDEFAQGLVRIEKALSVTQDFYNFWMAGRLAAGDGDFPRARDCAARIAEFFGAATEDSTRVEALAYRRFYYDLLGEIALRQKDFPRAIEMFEASLRFSMRVDSPFFRTYLGEACFESGDYRRAIEEFQRVLEINPNYPQTLLCLGETYSALGDERKAKEELQKLERLWVGADSSYPLKKKLDALLADLDHGRNR